MLSSLFGGADPEDVKALARRMARVEAKLDLIMKSLGLEMPPENANVPGDVLAALQRGDKIEAIKLLRTARGIGLKEAKDAVDEIAARVRP